MQNRPSTQPLPQDTVKNDDCSYSSLKDFKWEIEAGVASFCFWIYLPESTPFPATLIRQVHPGATASALLSLDERKRLLLWPLVFGHDRDSDVMKGEQGLYVYGRNAIDSPFGRWVHVGYEVSSGFLVLYVNGMIVQEKALSTNSSSGTLKKFCLLGAVDSMVDAYIFKVELQSSSLPVKEQYLKEPPLRLSTDFSCTSDVDEDNQGIWNIVSGKSSVRRTFTVGVVLLNALGRPSVKDMEATAALLYADNGANVETPFDEEAPLLTCLDGVEFASSDKLIRIQNGHASFKLKISQLSSKCDNRLFRIKFFIPNSGTWPFFETYSPPIRCISRGRDIHKNTYLVHTNGSQSAGLDKLKSGIPQQVVHDAIASKLAERFKTLGEKPSMIMRHHRAPVRPDEEVNSPSKFDGQVPNSSRTMPKEAHAHDETNISQSNSESTEEVTLESKGMSGSGRQFSDASVFKYCLGGLEERANILKELALSASDQDFAEFAQQVSLYSGCSHHWSQVAITKRLIEEGTRLWNVMSQNNEPLRWEIVVVEVQKQFLKIANTTRSLSEQDLSFLRKVSGCQGLCSHDNFEKLWSWLYPVALRLSISWMNSLWGSTIPHWIEGFITKEEAELSLQGSRGLQPPGTFVLRFPTSRSWPHPDAGNLVVTYVGSDCTLHHRLISLDYIHSSMKDKNAKSLQNMILHEPELSRLGRVIRS